MKAVTVVIKDPKQSVSLGLSLLGGRVSSAAIGDWSELQEAAQTVLDGLNARIDMASALGQPVPVFSGIADLHAALQKADPQ